MKVHVLNKHVEHDGVKYAKGAQIKASDKGFKEIVQAGHTSEISFEPEADSEAKPFEPAKPEGKSKK